MHSRIFQITTSRVPEDEYISESDFCEHPFIGSIADHVDGNVDRNEELQNLRQFLTDTKTAVFGKENSFALLPNGKAEYFKYAFDRFIKAVNKACGINLTDFATDDECSNLVFEIKSSYCDEFGWYVSSEEFDTITFDQFIRLAEPDKQYYIGGILNYRW